MHLGCWTLADTLEFCSSDVILCLSGVVKRRWGDSAEISAHAQQHAEFC